MIAANAYNFLTTADAVRDFAAAITEETKAALVKKTSKMPKAKALEFIAAVFPGFEAAETLTVRNNIESAYNATIIALTDRLEKLEAEAKIQLHVTSDAKIDNETTKLETIETLLADLHATTEKNTKKNIRAKLRRMGYYIGTKKAKISAK